MSNNIIELINRISSAIANKTKNEEAFTMLDISNLVKTDGGSWVDHTAIREIAKPIVDNVLLNVGYKVEIIDVITKSGPAKANLYCPYWYDPTDYVGISSVAIPPKNTTPVNANNTPAPVTPTAPANRTPYTTTSVTYRSDSAVEIPKRVIDEVYKLVGSTDFILANHPHSISLTYTQGKPGSNFKYFPGKRVSYLTLLDSNLDGRKLKFTVYSDKVVISAA